jgi:hypothetical protein
MPVPTTLGARRRPPPERRGRRRTCVVSAPADGITQTAAGSPGPRPRVGGRHHRARSADVRDVGAPGGRQMPRRDGNVRGRCGRGRRGHARDRCRSGYRRFGHGRNGLAGCGRRRRNGRRRRLCDAWHGRGGGLARRLRPRRRRLDDRPRGQHAQRVDVSLVLAGHAQAEVHVGLGQVDRAARPDRADGGALRDVRAARDADRAEMDERRRIAERRLDRDRLPTRRHRPGEADHPVRRREDLRAGRRAEFDAAVLAGGVRVRAVERERAQDRPVDGPRPRRSRRREDERTESDYSDSPEHDASLLPELRTARPYQERAFVVNTGYKVRR